MALSDTIADFLTRLRNAKQARLCYVDVLCSKMNVNLARVLKEAGFVDDFLVSEEKRKVRVFLRYTPGRGTTLHGLRRISKPGLRRYIGHDRIPKVLGGLGIAILSTPLGVIDGESARRARVGGEVLCYVW